jgi:hypothetical protein
VPKWTSHCASRGCAAPRLSAFRDAIRAARFVAVVPDGVREKLARDVRVASEVTALMARLLLAGIAGGAVPALALEVAPTFAEIAARCRRLAGQLAAGGLRAAVEAQGALCAVCEEMLADLRRKKAVDASRLVNALARAAAALTPEPPPEPPPPAPVPGGRPVPRPRGGHDAMSVEEFFDRFDEMKRRRLRAAAFADSLIEI